MFCDVLDVVVLGVGLMGVCIVGNNFIIKSCRVGFLFVGVCLLIIWRLIGFCKYFK